MYNYLVIKYKTDCMQNNYGKSRYFKRPNSGNHEIKKITRFK